LGFLSGLRIGGVLLACALAFVIPLIPRAWVKNRAEARRARFGEQLPQALDSLASGLSAGLSFQQAVGFASDELPDPVAGAMASLEQRISLGVPTDRALGRLLEDHPEEALALVVDGIVLQRRFGGDLVAMLESTADLLRERVELEREVRAITSQGRLSGWVVAALVPVSAGILLLSNPVYINVLFQTLIGQALVALALALQLAGWVIISRMVQIRY
jgi:tight adherence protein B